MTSDAVAEWFDLVTFSEPEDLRMWLGEHGAAELHRRGVRDLDVTDAATARAVAEVLVMVRGTVADTINGEPIG